MEGGTAAGATSHTKTSEWLSIMRTANTEERKLSDEHEGISDYDVGLFSPHLVQSFALAAFIR